MPQPIRDSCLVLLRGLPRTPISSQRTYNLLKLTELSKKRFLLTSTRARPARSCFYNSAITKPVVVAHIVAEIGSHPTTREPFTYVQCENSVVMAGLRGPNVALRLAFALWHWETCPNWTGRRGCGDTPTE